MAEEQQPTPPAGSSGRGRAQSWIGWSVAQRQAVHGFLTRQRPGHETIEIGFRGLIRDKQIAGGVLGGGLAYRLYFWVLGMVLLLCGGLGIAQDSGATIEGDAKELGLGSAVADSVGTAARQSGSARWWLVLAGLCLTLWFSVGVIRALRLVHAAAWQVTPPPLRDLPKAIAAVLAIPAAMIALVGLAGMVRAHSPFTVGLIGTLVVGVGYVAIIVVASVRLPSREVPWTAFLPGAICLAVGIEALHLFTVYYVGYKLANASELYGALGLASTALFYLFLIGRGIVWAAELNAVSWEVRHPPAGSEVGGRRIAVTSPTSAETPSTS